MSAVAASTARVAGCKKRSPPASIVWLSWPPSESVSPFRFTGPVETFITSTHSPTSSGTTCGLTIISLKTRSPGSATVTTSATITVIAATPTSPSPSVTRRLMR